MKRSLWTLTLSAALLTTGCFTMEHRLPPHTYFGALPAQPGEQSLPFRQEAMKNYWLSGLFPWTRWSSNALLTPLADGDRIEDLQMETRFSPLDVAISIFPGLVYGYYVWAPRSIGVSGRIVRKGG